MRAVSYPADTFPVSLLTPLRACRVLACGFQARAGAGFSSFTGPTAGTITTTEQPDAFLLAADPVGRDLGACAAAG